MKHLDPDRLLIKINAGKSLTDSEVGLILTQLETTDALNFGEGFPIDDIYTYIYILGKTADARHSYILEKFLDTHEPLTVGLVVEILCLDWQQYENYLERVISFALGISWDAEEDVRTVAIKILGEYLRMNFELRQSGEFTSSEETLQKVLELLLGIFDDPDQTVGSRGAAYLALSRAFGKKWEELPTYILEVDLLPQSTVVDYGFISQHRKIFELGAIEVVKEGNQLSSSSSECVVESISSSSSSGEPPATR